MTFEVLDPTYDEPPSDFQPAPRLTDLRGAVVGIVSNGKHGTVPFFDALETELRQVHGVGDVRRVVKSNYSAPAGEEIMDDALRWHALVAGIGD